MPRIAAHHRNSAYTLGCDWPDDCEVQWGERGIVLGRTGTVAFFEAFPSPPIKAGGFIRGEGETVADAELAAWFKFETRSKCEHHWGRNGYKNGGAICRKCRAFTTLFIPIFEFNQKRKPLNIAESSLLQMYEDEKAASIIKDIKKERSHREFEIRKRLFGEAKIYE